MNKRKIQIDILRLVALLGMILINFKMAMISNYMIDWDFKFLEGKFASLFIILSGMVYHPKSLKENFIKVCFLLFIGLLNLIYFQADIIHYYALFFFFGFFIHKLDIKQQVGIFVITSIISYLISSHINYFEYWNLNTLEYKNLFHPTAFLRHTFIDGWHPIFPWFLFFQWGMIFIKIATSKRTLYISCLLFILINILFYQKVISPLPSNIEFVLWNISLWSFIYSILNSFDIRLSTLLKLIISPARMTLSHYFFHIYIGMGYYEEINELLINDFETLYLRVIYYIGVIYLFTLLWLKKFEHGPIEFLLKKLIKYFKFPKSV